MSVNVHEAFSLDSFQDRLLFWDDFEGDQVKDEWRSTGSAGGSAVVVDAQTGGVVRITTDTDITDLWRIDWNDIRSLLASKKVTMELRVKLTQTTLMEAQLALFFDANEYIRFRYDTTVGANWIIDTDDGTGPTTGDSGEAADTDYHIFRIEALPTGEVHFYIDGDECANSPLTTDIPTTHLQPRHLIRTRENLVAKSMDIDYVHIRQER